MVRVEPRGLHVHPQQHVGLVKGHSVLPPVDVECGDLHGCQTGRGAVLVEAEPDPLPVAHRGGERIYAERDDQSKPFGLSHMLVDPPMAAGRARAAQLDDVDRTMPHIRIRRRAAADGDGHCVRASVTGRGCSHRSAGNATPAVPRRRASSPRTHSQRAPSCIRPSTSTRHEVQLALNPAAIATMPSSALPPASALEFDCSPAVSAVSVRSWASLSSLFPGHWLFFSSSSFSLASLMAAVSWSRWLGFVVGGRRSRGLGGFGSSR